MTTRQSPPPRRRTRSEVLGQRQHAVMGGCCDRFAEQKGCSCLDEALPDATPCVRCSGKGSVEVSMMDGYGGDYKTVSGTCRDCRGAGVIPAGEVVPDAPAEKPAAKERPRPDLVAIEASISGVNRLWADSDQIIRDLVAYARELEGLLSDKILDDDARLAQLAAGKAAGEATAAERERCAAIAEADRQRTIDRIGPFSSLEHNVSCSDQAVAAGRIAIAIREDDAP